MRLCGRLRAAAAAMLSVLGVGCTLFVPPLPPFRYLSVELHTGNDPGRHAAVGIVYTLANVSEQAITELDITFWVFDADGEPFPVRGRNVVRASAVVTIEPGAEAEVCTSLDDVFYAVPEEPLQITSFIVSRVLLEDDSVWHDRLARFPYPNTIPVVEVGDADS